MFNLDSYFSDVDFQPGCLFGKFLYSFFAMSIATLKYDFVVRKNAIKAALTASGELAPLVHGPGVVRVLALPVGPAMVLLGLRALLPLRACASKARHA